MEDLKVIIPKLRAFNDEKTQLNEINRKLVEAEQFDLKKIDALLTVIEELQAEVEKLRFHKIINNILIKRLTVGWSDWCSQRSIKMDDITEDDIDYQIIVELIEEEEEHDDNGTVERT